MKITSSEKKKEFKPIDITITVESKRELEILTTLFNLNNNKLVELINSGSNKYLTAPISVEELTILNQIWHEMDYVINLT